MSILENLFDKYYIYRDEIFLGVSILLCGIFSVGLIMMKDNFRCVANKLLQTTFWSVVIIGIGKILCLMGISPQIEYKYFNILIYMGVVSVVLFYAIILSIIYFKIKIPMIQMCKYIEYITVFELFLLSISGRLEMVEILIGNLLIVVMELIPMMLFAIEDNQKEGISADLDYPNSDLYYTREKQLVSFIKELKYQNNEPYAIMINAEWGMGKSSFIKALEERLEDAEFIYLKAGSEKSVSEIMAEVSEQIVDVLKKNNILIEKEILIEKYFLAFSGFLEDTDLGFLGKIVNLFDNPTVCESEEYLKSKLGELKKNIYLVIDDLDRCDEEYQEKMFKVIRESTHINGCKTIFLVDKSKFLGNSSKSDYIEKYINYTLDLCKVEYQEILDYYINKIFDEEFTREIKDVLLNGRMNAEIKELIGHFPQNVLQRFEEELKQEEEIHRKRNEKNRYQSLGNDNILDKEDEEYEKAKIEEYKNVIQTVNRNLSNSRKVKNYLKGIKRNIGNLNVGINECYQEFKQEDWLQAVIEVQFIKYILPELFKDIKECNDLWEYGEKTQSHIFKTITGLKYGFLFSGEKKIMILNEIAYNVDVIDFANVMSERSRYLEELDSDKATIKHINQYLEYSQNLDDLTKVLNLCLRQEFENYIDRENFVKDILDILSRQSKLMKYKKKEFLNFSVQLIECFSQLKLSEKEINICIYEGRMIIRRVIIDNTHLLRNILMVLFDVTTVGECLQSLGISDIDEFYKILKRIDDKSLYGGLEDDGNKLLSIKKYYANLIEELKKEKYEKVGLDVDQLADNLNTVFNICQLWDNINILLEKNDEETVLFKRYFELNGVYSFKDTVFENFTHLKLALKELNDFYDKKETSYESEYTLILLRLAYKMVLLIEAKPSWYGNKTSEIAELLMSVAEKCYALDNNNDDFTCDVIDETKVYVYKFLSYVQNAEELDVVENNQVID